MSAAIVLDAGPLSTLANPRHSPLTLAARQWLAALQVAGRRVLVAEIQLDKAGLVQHGMKPPRAGLVGIGRHQFLVDGHQTLLLMFITTVQ